MRLTVPATQGRCVRCSGLLRALGVKGVIVIVVLILLGVWIRTTFFHYIDASAELHDDSFGLASTTEKRYTATLNVHVGHPTDVNCIVGAETTDGSVAATSTFTMLDMDGEVELIGGVGPGTLNVGEHRPGYRLPRRYGDSLGIPIARLRRGAALRLGTSLPT